MIYLDNSATTPVSDIARMRLFEGCEKFANPSSLHEAGLGAQKLIGQARTEVALSLGIRNTSAYKIIFTSSGTEADNLAIFGVARAKNRRFTPRIITTDSEHSAILRSLDVLKNEGFDIVTLSTKGGIIDPDELKAAINENTVLLSIMTVNNETGAVYDIKNLFAIAKRLNPDVITHTDCVQGFLKIPFSLPSVKADMVTVSGHKIHAPKGTGALIVSEPIIKSKKLIPLIYGGGQESGLRSGTENVAGIYALGGASKEGLEKLPEFSENAKKLRNIFAESLDPSIRVNTPMGDFAPHIISVTLPDIKSETMLHYLSSKGICVSSGSACSSNGGHKNAPLEAFGLSAHEADCTVRVSLSVYTSEDDVKTAAQMINTGIRSLVKIK